MERNIIQIIPAPPDMWAAHKVEDSYEYYRIIGFALVKGRGKHNKKAMWVEPLEVNHYCGAIRFSSYGWDKLVAIIHGEPPEVQQ